MDEDCCTAKIAGDFEALQEHAHEGLTAVWLFNKWGWLR